MAESEYDGGQMAAYVADVLTGHPLRALSAHFLATIVLDEIRDAGFEDDAKVFEIEEQVIRAKGEAVMCPIREKLGSSYVEAVKGQINVGIALYMLSYTWGYEVRDIVHALTKYCQDCSFDPKATYVWICAFCINQHHVKELQSMGASVPFDDFKEAFGQRVRQIGSVLALMQPWVKPRYLTRVWCVFEMHTAISMDDCQVIILMPPEEARSLCSALETETVNLNSVWKVLANVDVAQAEASVQSDKDHIMQIVQETTGLAEVNNAVSSYLKAWFEETVEGHVRNLIALTSRKVSDHQLVSACRTASDLIRDSGHFDRAKALFQLCAPVIEDKGALARLTQCMGSVDLKRGRPEDALVSFGVARELLVEADLGNSGIAALLLNSMAAANRKLGRLSEAMSFAEEAREIHVSLGSSTTESGLLVLGQVALIKELQGDLSHALETYEQIKAHLVAAGSLTSSNGAMMLNSIGNAKFKLGNLAGALDAYMEAKEIRVRLNILDTPLGAEMLMGIGRVKLQQGEVDSAQAEFAKSKVIFEKHNALQTPPGQELIRTMMASDPS